MKPITIEEMINDGCSKKFAEYYYNLLRKEWESGLYDADLLNYAHENGFLAESICAYGVSLDNYSDYLSDYDYYKIWPLNDWMRIWVNDKLTLKYMLSGTEFDGVMPKYYFYSLNEGLRKLMDNNSEKQSMEGFFECLEKVGDFACKPANGSGAEGFIHLEFDGRNYKINNVICEKKDIVEFVDTHPNYVFTEYLLPDKSLADLSNNLIHTIRVIVVNEDGINPRIEAAYIRFATKLHGASNYFHDSANDEMYNLFVRFNYESGEFGEGYAVYNQKVEAIQEHPDSGIKLRGKIVNWNKMRDKILNISKFFFGVEWLGFDICVDRNAEMRIMEINTHPAIKIVQLYQPINQNEYLKEYFDKKLNEINLMNDKEKKMHSELLR